MKNIQAVFENSYLTYKGVTSIVRAVVHLYSWLLTVISAQNGQMHPEWFSETVRSTYRAYWYSLCICLSHKRYILKLNIKIFITNINPHYIAILNMGVWTVSVVTEIFLKFYSDSPIYIQNRACFIFGLYQPWMCTLRCS